MTWPEFTLVRRLLNEEALGKPAREAQAREDEVWASSVSALKAQAH